MSSWGNTFDLISTIYGANKHSGCFTKYPSDPSLIFKYDFLSIGYPLVFLKNSKNCIISLIVHHTELWVF